MGLFKKDYGQQGKLTQKQWKDKLSSDIFLFKKADKMPQRVLGPTLDDNGKVIGDMFALETMAFNKVATKEQYDFYMELLSVNQPAAKEYMLTISGSIAIWKKDMKWLGVAQQYLEKEEDTLEDEEVLLEEGEKLNVRLHLPEVLKRHFPEVFKDIDMIGNDVKQVLEKVRSVEKRVKQEEDYLNGYLKKMREEMPFLFEK